MGRQAVCARAAVNEIRLFARIVTEDGKLTDQPWPEWWYWELELSPHLLKRMVDRGFTQVDLRRMLEEATGHEADIEPGRWIVETARELRRWHIIVEPDSSLELLVVITAYPVD